MAVKDTLFYGFQVTLAYNLMDLICKGFFLQHPTPHLSHPFWSLQKVLKCVVFSNFSSNTVAERKLEKALLLVALALGFRALQLHILTHRMAWTVFVPDGSKVSFALFLMILAKTELEGHHLDPFIILARI